MVKMTEMLSEVLLLRAITLRDLEFEFHAPH